MAYLQNLTPEQLAATQARVTGELWRQGKLRYKLHDSQLPVYDGIQRQPGGRHFLMCPRRFGKSHICLVIGLEQALSVPNSRIVFIGPFARNADEIASDLSTRILEDCPAQVRPEYRAQAKEFVFRNGSIIRLRGTNGDHAQYLRGGAADLVILDEAALMDDFAHVLNDIVEPMPMTTHGRVLIATTPPRTPGHESVSIMEQYHAVGAVSVMTIVDATHIPYEHRRRALLNAGEKEERVDGILRGEIRPETITARREYFCELVTDASMAVVPEFTPEARAQIIREHVRPSHFDGYCAIDPGARDKTAILVGYVDFREGKLVIEGEALLGNPSTQAIADSFRALEAEHLAGREPHRRVSDIDLRLIQDLQREHQLRVFPAKKDDFLASVNQLRHYVQTGRLIINPRCKQLIFHLSTAIWNRKAADVARVEATETREGHHYDTIAALRYMLRAIDWSHNPYPAHFFARGGAFGVAADAWVSPRTTRKERTLGLFPDSPLGRRLAGVKRTR